MATPFPDRLASSFQGVLWVVGALFFLIGTGLASGVGAADLDASPIRYAVAADSNPVSRLRDAVVAGKLQLAFDADKGYLPAVLKALDVPVSSQMLVFSKTSLQRQRIAPATPRALYFNDEVYVGYCQSGDVMEFSVADPGLGTVFYTLEQQGDGPARFIRQTESCLICHGSSATQGFPGHLARSVYPDTEGHPIFSLGTSRVEHSTPLSRRWGGWYVTGGNPGREHLGNMILPKTTRFQPAKNPHGTTCDDLSPFMETKEYLSPHSDLVALLVFEHQAEVHNRLTRTALETRIALYQQEEYDRILSRHGEGLFEGTARRIDSACESLVEYLFFCGESPLGGKVRGTSAFTTEFPARGPRDTRGRSLRDFDLTERMFKHQLSYMVLSKSFADLPRMAHAIACAKIIKILAEGPSDPKYAHLTAEKRALAREILAGSSPVWQARLAGK